MSEGVAKFLRKTFTFRKETKASHTSDHGVSNDSNATRNQIPMRHSFSAALDQQHPQHDAYQKQIVSEKSSYPFTPVPPQLQPSSRRTASPRSSSTTFRLLGHEKPKEVEEDDEASVTSRRSIKTDLTQEDGKCMAKLAEDPSMSR